MQLLHVVGARPNFMKLAPVHLALKARGMDQTIVHTGQHYDAAMSQVFFDQLGLPAPDVNLEVGSGSHAEQTAAVLSRFEKVLLGRRPDWVVVYGDVNSTMAATLVCSKLGIRVAHVEAGLRSFDRRMPEEINRLVTDQIADLLFTPSEDADAHLKREGIPPQKIRLVGNVMIDTLVRCLPLLPKESAGPVSGPFALVTLHRPSNVDDPATLAPLMEALTRISARLPVVFPVHPRTAKRIEELPGFTRPDRIKLMAPIGYLEFLGLEKRATVVVTDSGGIQEETTYLGVPCLTLRENTERPVTVSIGTNLLIGFDYSRLEAEVERAVSGTFKKGAVPPLWDGRAGERIAGVFAQMADSDLRPLNLRVER
jgi:UDP-N-acetylglucosamine 2-epimerase (non-hydrolysing)